MHRKRVTGRFYFFIALLLAGALFVIWQFLPTRVSEAVVTEGESAKRSVVEAVIIRDEEVTTHDGNGRVVYIAAEGMRVSQGDEIAEVYASGYAETELQRLDTVRKNIREYHKTILDNILDAELERLENNVQSKALELKTLLDNKTTGNFQNVERQLKDAMAQRQDYLGKNRRQDMKLNDLYDQEAKRANSIESWKKVQTADRDGVVSFYLDGCERFLTPSTMGRLSIQEVRSILKGNAPDTPEGVSAGEAVYRLVDPNKWYMLIVTTAAQLNPVNEQEYAFQIEGYEGIVYTGTVVGVIKEGDEIMAQLEITGDIGSLINKRTGRAILDTNLRGLSVPLDALSTQDGQTGVWINDVPGGSFIKVEVLSTEDGKALIQPLTEGAVKMGDRILIK